MYVFTQKDLIASGEIITTWSPDYEEFDIDMIPTIHQSLVECQGTYYIAVIDIENNTPMFPDEAAILLDV